MKMRALSSQSCFRHKFSKSISRFSKMDKNKCPKSKTQFTFWNFFVIESFANISIVFLLPIIIMIFQVLFRTINIIYYIKTI